MDKNFSDFNKILTINFALGFIAGFLAPLSSFVSSDKVANNFYRLLIYCGQFISAAFIIIIPIANIILCFVNLLLYLKTKDLKYRSRAAGFSVGLAIYILAGVFGCSSLLILGAYF